MNTRSLVSRWLHVAIVVVLIGAISPVPVTPAEAVPLDIAATVAPAVISAESTRIDGIDRFDTNVGLSQDGWASSEYVVIASGRSFPDALVGTPLAAALDAPVLLAEPDGIPSQVQAEIERLGATKAVILGGSAALSSQIEADLAALGISGDAVERIAGADRYETAALVAEKVAMLTGMSSGWAVVATGENYPDALAISPWAGAMGAPILLTRRDSLPAATEAAIASIDPTAITVVGGEAAVSEAVVEMLPPSHRLAGSDRYHTAKLVAEWASDHDFDFDNIYVAKGTDWPDALGAGAVAARLSGLIMLTPPDRVDDDTLEFFLGHCSSIEQIHFVGGVAAISASVAVEILEASETHLNSTDLVLIAGTLLDAFEGADADSATFSDTAIARERVREGKILVLNRMHWLDQSDPLSQGFVRRVTGVSTGDGVIIATTEDAPLTDFLKKGSIDVDIEPMTADHVAMQYETAELIEEARAAGRPVDVSVSTLQDYTYHFEDERNLWHNEAETASLDSTLTVDLEVWADFQAYFVAWSPQAITFRVGVVEKLNAALGFSWADQLEDQEHALASIPIAYYGFDVGPISLGLGIEMEPVIGFEQVTGEFDAEFRLSQFFYAQLYTVWTPTTGTQVYTDTASSFDTEFDAHGKATARPYVGIKVAAVICGSDANTIYIMPDAYLWAQAEGEFHAWDNFEHTSGELDAELEFGVECRMGYGIDLFGLWSSSNYYALNVYNTTWTFGVGYVE